MIEYINKEVARRIIDSERSKEQMLTMLDNTPTADVKPVMRGEWVVWLLRGNGLSVKQKCTNCKEIFDFGMYIPNYCPNCGAEMRGGK